MKRLIIYDLDGTLVDTLEDIVQSANHMLALLRAPSLSAREIRRYVGKGLRELVRCCLQTEEYARIEEGIALYRAHYARHLLDHARLYPGVLAFLEYCQGRHQIVITNKPNPFSLRILEALGIARYFEEVIAGDSGYPHKPDPTTALAAMKARGVAPKETVLIGDSSIDVKTGRSAFISTVALLHGLGDEEEIRSAAPEAVVADFAQLLELAMGQGW